MNWDEQMSILEPNVNIDNEMVKELVSLQEYVTSNIPGPGADHALFEVQYAGCRCKDDCVDPDLCNCIARYGRNYFGSTLMDESNGTFARPIFECNEHCSCLRRCSNRQVQRGIEFRLCIFEVENCGLGLKTLDFIPRNLFVCEYAGEVISKETASERAGSLGPDDANYVLAVREHRSDIEVFETFVDPKFKGNVGRFVNHSCSPNMHMVPVRVNTAIPKASLFALRDISPGEELTYHYSGFTKDFGAEQKNKSRTRCHCRSENCSGYLPFHQDLFS